LLRSCYTTTARFFRDTDAETTIRWFFCGEDAPFVPNSGPFDSRNWESDPKGQGHLGEVQGAPREYYRGDAPIQFGPDHHFCGSGEQWVNGERLPPDDPVPLDGAGVPLCCQAPPGQLPVWPLLWLRPEELPAAPDGTPVSHWGKAPSSHLSAVADPDGDPPLLKLDVATGKRGLVLREASLTPADPTVRRLRLEKTLTLGDQFSLYLVVRNGPEAGSGGVSFQNDDDDTRLPKSALDGVNVRIADVNLDDDEGTDLAELLYWSIHRDANKVNLYKNGVFVNGDDEFTDADASLMRLQTAALSDLDNSVWVGEVLVYDRLLPTAGDTAVKQYLKTKYDLPV